MLSTRRACQGWSTDTQGEAGAEAWGQHSEGAKRSPPLVLHIANEPGQTREHNGFMQTTHTDRDTHVQPKFGDLSWSSLPTYYLGGLSRPNAPLIF